MCSFFKDTKRSEDSGYFLLQTSCRNSLKFANCFEESSTFRLMENCSDESHFEKNMAITFLCLRLQSIKVDEERLRRLERTMFNNNSQPSISARVGESWMSFVCHVVCNELNGLLKCCREWVLCSWNLMKVWKRLQLLFESLQKMEVQLSVKCSFSYSFHFYCWFPSVSKCDHPWII